LALKAFCLSLADGQFTRDELRDICIDALNAVLPVQS
jgi:hypothetical protein